MVRPFAPRSFGIDANEFYAVQTESRLRHSGEYVRHVPSGTASPQWVVVNYQHIPVDANTAGDYMIPATNPKLWGLLPHFEVAPAVHKAGNSARAATGSRFEIRGLMFVVKSVRVNHRGGLHCELDLEDNCADPRVGFFEERDALLCLDERPCADI